MAIVKAGVGTLRMDLIGLNASGNVSFGPTDIRLTSKTDGTDYTDFFGSYDFSTGFPVGTVTSIVDTVDGKTHYSVTGVNADASTLFGYIQRGDIIGAEAYVLRNNDTVTGGKLDDYLYGFGGNDAIKAGGGADVLVGGAGRDKLTGGGGNDTFLFLDSSDSTVAQGGRDSILDFHHTETERDKIDLSAIDANENTARRNDSFSLVGAFTGHAGELLVTEVRGGFLVQGDTDGVDGADFSIFVKTDVPLVVDDFRL